MRGATALAIRNVDKPSDAATGGHAVGGHVAGEHATGDYCDSCAAGRFPRLAPKACHAWAYSWLRQSSRYRTATHHICQVFQII